MLKNYILIAWRNLIRNGTFYFINVAGLSVGLACCLLISSYLYSELTYDTYPEKADQIYRVELHVTGNGHAVDYGLVDTGVGPGIKQTYPEVNAYVRMAKGWQPYLKYKEVLLKEEHMVVADSNFLEFFSIPLLEGNIKTALTEPNNIVVSKAFAQKYFGDENPIGKVLTFGQNGEFKVTGLIEKIPDQTHFHFDAIVSLATWHITRETWSNLGMYTYIRLNDHADPVALEHKFPDLVKKYVVPEVMNDMGVSLAEAEKSISTFVFSLQPLRRIHLYSHSATEIEANGDIKYVYIFSALAVFILLLACVNFTNLATAASAKRSREVGLRKVMGSVKSQLIRQFLTESTILASGAMIFAYGIVFLTLPYFNLLTGKMLGFGFFLQPGTLLFVVAGSVITGVVAGIYPAFFLSSFNTIAILKGATVSGKRERLRSGLVVFQFAVSTSLIIATIVVYQQLYFMQNKKLGYDKDQVVVINDTFMLKNNENVFKEQLLKDSRVINATVSAQVPGTGNQDGTQAYPKDKSAMESNAEIHIDIFHVDYDYLKTLGITMRTGRNLSPEFLSDSSGIVINESAAREFGWDPDASVGNSIVTSGQHEYHVVGVVRDFNYLSVRQKIGSLVMMLGRNRGFTLVKINPTDVKAFLDDVKKQWVGLGVDAPFSYSFLDEKFAALYFAEERTGRIFTTFAVIALIIAALGLFGLSAFTAEQRTREIGVRKVLGASVPDVLFMLSRQFLTLVLIAFIIAIPIVAWAMDRWLSDFAYRISLSWWVFALAGVLSFSIAFFSMCFQVIKAATANPVKSLRMD